MSLTDAYVFDAVRTPFGKVGGALSGVRPDDMAAQALSAPFLAEHRRTPLDYRLLAEILAARPVLDDLMLASLTPTRIHDIAHEDLRTASDALASPWQFIRRHAAIVLLSSHL